MKQAFLQGVKKADLERDLEIHKVVNKANLHENQAEVGCVIHSYVTLKIYKTPVRECVCDVTGIKHQRRSAV